MQIQNTETGEIDTVNNKQALAVIARTDGLWIEYREPEQVKESKVDLSSTGKQSPSTVKRKRNVKRQPK